MHAMNILAIETSCDETSAAIVCDGRHILSNVTTSSQDIFSETGGVIPEEAARKQVESILPIIDACIHAACIAKNDIDSLAVTRGPGLLGSLIVGTTTARTLASVWKKPLIGVHHTLGHLTSPWLTPKDKTPDEIVFPILALSASGGHTDLWYRTSHTSGILLGRTLDDAAGEAFDKGASMLGLPYPGGPSIARTAEHGDENAFPFPLPLRGKKGLNYSFSGLKTALKYTIRDHGTDALTDIAASYQHAICRHLCVPLEKALEQYPDVHEIHIVGGVSANQHLRSLAANISNIISVRTPIEIPYCTDNAAMIAAAAFFLHAEKNDEAFATFSTEASLPIECCIKEA